MSGRGYELPAECLPVDVGFELICTACGGITRDPVQTRCGHRYCKGCLAGILHERTGCVASDCSAKSELEYEEKEGEKVYFYPDAFVKKQVSKIIALCKNHSKGCGWKGTLEEWEKHTEQCDYGATACHGYEEVVPKNKSIGPGAALNNQLSISKDTGCSVSEEETQGQKCEVCECKDPTGSVPIQQDPNEHDDVQQPGSVLRLDFAIEQSSHGNLGNLTESGYHSDTEKGTQKKGGMNIASNLMVRKGGNPDGSAAVKKSQDSLRIPLMLEEIPSYNGELIWRIPNFKKHQEDAESHQFLSIYSLPFYTSRYGYKMCLRLYPYGDGSGKGTHLSLFIVIMRGEYDDILEWPYRHEVTFQLLNLKGEKDITISFRADPESSSFKKPVSDMNVATGCPCFAQLDTLQSQGFIANDTMYIRAKVEWNGNKLGRL